MRIIFATGNQHKMIEVREILGDLNLEILSLKDLDLDLDIVEDGTTFEENALIKAKAVAQHYPNDLVLSDDSGLEVKALNNEPGIFSARYAGENTSYHIKNQMIIERLEGYKGEERKARFVCAVAAVAQKEGMEQVQRGEFCGQIAYKEDGSNGFGYDPIFYVPTYDCTSSQMSPELKNKLSHRGQALQKIKPVLKEWIAR